MKMNHLLVSAAVATVLVMSVPVHAQILGGAARGGAGGAFGGSFGSFGTMGSGNGRASAGIDKSFHLKPRPQRAADEKAEQASNIGARASDHTTGAVREGREGSQAVTQGTILTGAAEMQRAKSLSAGAAADTESTATFVGENGKAAAPSGGAQSASNTSKPAQGSVRPARSGSSPTQRTGDDPAGTCRR